VTDESPLDHEAARCIETNGAAIVRPDLQHHLLTPNRIRAGGATTASGSPISTALKRPRSSQGPRVLEPVGMRPVDGPGVGLEPGSKPHNLIDLVEVGEDVKAMHEAGRQRLDLYTTFPFLQRLFRVSGFGPGSRPDGEGVEL
jgi:hypothetical protein